MTLKDFATKYHLNSEELLELLVFENFPITSPNDEIDDRVLQYLLEYTNKKNKNKLLQKNKKDYFNHHSKNVSIDNKKTQNKKIFLYAKPMTINECMNLTGLSASSYINFFIARQKLFSINSIISKEDVLLFAKENNIDILENNTTEEKNNKNIVVEKKISIKGNEKRNPIVVVVGHVDHGKTTLLDTIRKQSIAKSEKGGITQHVGAYETSYNNNQITFLDTPGHEAFTALRLRGVTIADIGVLVIAADDGMKPQTIESIKMLKELKVSIIVAITKIDRMSERNFDHIYTDLTSFDLVPESWGGNIPIVFVSAPKNEGISDLLDTILLLADLADLKTNTSSNASGYVLETKIEPGKGVVATILLQEGKLSIGDSFYCGGVWGKIVSCITTELQGKHCKEMLPSKPYIISGFSDFPQVGGNIIQAPLKIAKEYAEEYKINSKMSLKNNGLGKSSLLENKKPYYIIVKADVFSSLQAIEQAIEKLKNSVSIFYVPIIIHQGLGQIIENDINIAINSGAIIYLFNVKKTVNKELTELIEKNNITVLYFDVIYHLLEHMEKEVTEEKNKEVALKKIGEVVVLKLFAIKGVGNIIGFRVLQGNIKINAIGMVFHNKVLVGKGPIRSLQKDKQAVKELGKGHEGALSIPTVNGIQEQDIIEIYSE